MTRSAKKVQERHFVEEAARRLDAKWQIGPDREHPDFLVSDGNHQFGLEVCEIFTGTQGKAGSAMKKGESERQRQIDTLRQQYEAINGIPLDVKIVGHINLDDFETIISALVGADFVSKPISTQVTLDIRGGLSVYATKAFRPRWFSVSDRTGWVDRWPLAKIAEAMEKKAKELDRYKMAAGADIRLLVVANRMHNSGKLMLEEPIQLNDSGFQKVYFFSYPESVAIID